MLLAIILITFFVSLKGFNDLKFFDYSYQNMNPDKFIDPFEDYYKT